MGKGKKAEGRDDGARFTWGADVPAGHAFGERAGMVNAYTCDTCGGKIVVALRDDGVTPATIACRASDSCGGGMWSAFYRGAFEAGSAAYRVLESAASWEWMAPDRAELIAILDRVRQRARDHGRLDVDAIVEQALAYYRRGGLYLRRRGEPIESQVGRAAANAGAVAEAAEVLAAAWAAASEGGDDGSRK